MVIEMLLFSTSIVIKYLKLKRNLHLAIRTFKQEFRPGSVFIKNRKRNVNAISVILKIVSYNCLFTTILSNFICLVISRKRIHPHQTQLHKIIKQNFESRKRVTSASDFYLFIGKACDATHALWTWFDIRINHSF